MIWPFLVAAGALIAIYYSSSSSSSSTSASGGKPVSGTIYIGDSSKLTSDPAIGDLLDIRVVTFDVAADKVVQDLGNLNVRLVDKNYQLIDPKGVAHSVYAGRIQTPGPHLGQTVYLE